MPFRRMKSGHCTTYFHKRKITDPLLEYSRFLQNFLTDENVLSHRIITYLLLYLWETTEKFDLEIEYIVSRIYNVHTMYVKQCIRILHIKWIIYYRIILDMIAALSKCRNHVCVCIWDHMECWTWQDTEWETDWVRGREESGWRNMNGGFEGAKAHPSLPRSLLQPTTSFHQGADTPSPQTRHFDPPRKPHSASKAVNLCSPAPLGRWWWKQQWDHRKLSRTAGE